MKTFFNYSTFKLQSFPIAIRIKRNLPAMTENPTPSGLWAYLQMHLSFSHHDPVMHAPFLLSVPTSHLCQPLNLYSLTPECSCFISSCGNLFLIPQILACLGCLQRSPLLTLCGWRLHLVPIFPLSSPFSLYPTAFFCSTSPYFKAYINILSITYFVLLIIRLFPPECRLHKNKAFFSSATTFPVLKSAKVGAK